MSTPSPWQQRLQRCGESQLFIHDSGSHHVHHSGKQPEQRGSLLLLHGISDWGDNLLPLAELLRPQLRCIIPDLRGHGYSQRQDDYRLASYVADILALVQDLPGPLWIYGHSLGGLIALRVAAEKPPHLAGVVLEDPPLFHFTHSIHRRPKIVAAFRATAEDLVASAHDPHRLLQLLAARDPEAELSRLRRRAEQLRRCDPGIWQPVLADRLCADASSAAQLANISCPLTLLAGDPQKGAAVHPEDVQALSTLLPHTQVQHFPGCGHHIRARDLDGVAAAVRAMLATGA